MTPDGTRAYTCNKEAEYISVIDLTAERLIRKLTFPGGSEQPGISLDGSLAFFPFPAIGRKDHDPCINVLDTASNEFLHSIPLELGAVTVHGDCMDRIIAGLYRIEVDEATRKPTPSYGGVACFKASRLTYEHLGTVELGLVPLTILAHPDGSRAFISNIFDGTVSVLELASMKVLNTIEVDLEKRSDKAMHQGAHGLALI